MFVPLLMSLAVASGAIFLSINSTEEMVKIAGAFIALVCCFFSLVFAPLIIKLIIVAAPFVSNKFRFVETSER
ncbi:MAG: hypothetical protein SAL07_12275 [Oscillatoria sp. PMC 1051.18]|nr:hypothetical protein [Oscillatoria sp. PMC 1050.18]MEC5030664.1 hypothetical protein [Oscillatoria sp. PMC 1051.18]